VHGYQNTADVAFGGDDWKTVFLRTRTSLGSFRVKIPGVPVVAREEIVTGIGGARQSRRTPSVAGPAGKRVAPDVTLAHRHAAGWRSLIGR
jgi:hypothetical protein